MKPIIIFRHECCENAGYLGHFLKERNIPWQAVRLDLGQPIPISISAYSGIVLMGGPMSVNDELPWIRPLIKLIEQAFAADVPVMGHCLGGQLMSKALGASVKENPVQEVGWGALSLQNNDLAKRWFGEGREFLGFHWHNETFDLPSGVTHLLSSEHCQHQAYSFGKHLAMQCHIEMTIDLVNTWCERWHETLEVSAHTPAMQSMSQIYDNIQTKLQALNAQAEYTYNEWVKGLAI